MATSFIYICIGSYLFRISAELSDILTEAATSNLGEYIELNASIQVLINLTFKIISQTQLSVYCFHS
jgi:hypothetical protein